MSDEFIGTQLGQYQLEELIGRGGMAKVYKAYQPSLDRYVAIKILLHRHDPQFAARFTREARAIARLQHHNIVPIYDYSEQDGLLYIAMQYIENGTTLGDMLSQPIAPPAALRLMKHLLDALGYAHSNGIIHRDIKPGNILLPTPVWPMLTDFGIAKLGNQGLPALTIPGMALGTPAYMAPEQAYGHAVDARTDLYSTGVVLYEMLTGQVPFEGESPLFVLTKHVSEPPPPPRQINPHLPVAVEPVLQRALAKDPAARYQSAAEFSDDLDQLALLIDENRQSQQLAIFYQAGMQAFKAGQWDEAVKQLTRWTEQNPGSTDASAMLAAAREQQERSQNQARRQNELEQVKTSGQPTLMPEAGRSRETSDLKPLAEPAKISTPPPAGVAQERETAASPRRSMGIFVALGAVVLGIVGLVLVLTLRGGANQANAPTAAPLQTAATQGQAAQATSGQAATTLAPTTASASPEAAPTAGAALPDPVGQLVFQDTFADLNKSGLDDRPDDADFARGPGAQGGYQLTAAKPNEVRWAVLPHQAYTNFSLAVDLRDDSASLDGSAAQGMVFRVRDDTHLYAVLVDPRGGRYAIQKAAGADGLADLVAWKDSPLVRRGKEANQLRVDAQENQFTIYLNGAQLDSFQDQDNQFGMIGLLAANLGANAPRMQFDNLMVWSSDTAPAPPELAPTRKTNAADMVLIRGGAFIMGSNIGDTTQPPHIVELSDFYIDRTEVTNFDYLHCVDVGGCTPINPPDSATHKNYATDFAFANFPALNMPWQQARDFCTWAEKRLPTEAEWEKAATWNSATRTKSIWPWGNRFDPERANTAESGSGDTTKVGQFFEEQNHTYDMAGNVAEWTSSLDKPYPYVADDGREDPAGSGARVIRGGSWDDPQEQTRGSVRQAVDPTSFSTKLGFRCAANP